MAFDKGYLYLNRAIWIIYNKIMVLSKLKKIIAGDEIEIKSHGIHFITTSNPNTQINTFNKNDDDDIKLVISALISFTIILSIPFLIFFSIKNEDQAIIIFNSLFVIIPILLLIVLYLKQLKALNNKFKKTIIFINPLKNILYYISWIKADEQIIEIYKSKSTILNFTDHFQTTIVETNKAFYIDKRSNKFIDILLLLISIPFFIIVDKSDIELSLLIFVVIILVTGHMLYPILFPLNNIKYIQKKYIETNNSDINKIHLRGAYPRRSQTTLNPDKSWGNFKTNFNYKFKIK